MAGRIPSHKVDEIYNAADIVDVVGEFLDLKKRGTNYFALSPFSNEKTPSFAVSPSKNIFKDFSSGKGGNAVTFLMEAEGMTYVEALKWLAERYNIELEFEESTAEEEENKDHRDSLYIINEFAARWFQEQLNETDEGRIARAYFKERGIIDATIKNFGLGYAPESWDAFAQTAAGRQYNEEYLIETGLVFKSDKTGNLTDRFRGRVMFPIHSHTGKVVGFGGRILKSDQKFAKYINSPESAIYHKSRVLYGLHQAKKAIRDQDQCILVEGYMDVISLAQSGIENAVAASGTALTEDQIRLIRRFSKNVLLIFDADPAGIKAALRGLDLMLGHEMNVRILLLPEGEDPDSFVQKHGKAGFEEKTKEQSKDFLQFKLEQLTKEYSLDDPVGRAEVIRELSASVSRIPDQIKREVYIRMLSQQMDISESALFTAVRQEFMKRSKFDRRQKQEYPPEGADISAEVQQKMADQAQQAPGEDGQEREILRLLLNYADHVFTPRQIDEEEDEDGFASQEVRVIEYVYAEIESTFTFKNPILEELRQSIFLQYEQHGEININRLMDPENPKMSTLVSDLISIPYEVSPNWEKFDIKAPKIDGDIANSVFSAIMHFQLSRVKILMKEAREKMKAAEDKEEQEKRLEQYIFLKNRHIELARILGIIVSD